MTLLLIAAAISAGLALFAIIIQGELAEGDLR
jgi:hypothetical protein